VTIDYTRLADTIASLTDGENDDVALMATVVCEVYHSDDRFAWVGFYRVTEPELMKIGPYQGGHGCLAIPFSRGVCGKAAKTGQAHIIDDANDFSGHIACSSSTISEIVFPVTNAQGKLIGVFDIDSDQKAAFDSDDMNGLGNILKAVFSK
jgi:L-methionine (R)-S-oxide reductase